MGTPASKAKTINVVGNEIAELQRNLHQALADEKRIKAYIADLKARIKKRMGDAGTMKVNGVVAFTWAPTESFAWSKFAEEHGDIAERYKVTVEKEVLDTTRLSKEHPTLVEPFRTRQFLVK